MNFSHSLAVLMVCVCALSFSGSAGFSPPLEDEQPMAAGRKTGDSALGVSEGEGAVLTVRYAGGQVQEVRLEQGAPPKPPLADRRLLCKDLCRAGLGGISCGANCYSLIPRTLVEIWHKNEMKQITNKNYTTTPQTIYGFGTPRVEICPVLCDNGLGQPICGCNKTVNMNVQWDYICDLFCIRGSYQLQGCPECASAEIIPKDISGSENPYGNMHEIWVEWCNYQCHKGEGGAACNCDLAPLKLNP